MISISAISTNLSVVFNADPNSDWEKFTARVTRRATLDGGSIITHSGFSHTDRDISISANLTAAQWLILRELAQTQTQVNLSMPDGFYRAMIRSTQNVNGAVKIDLYLVEKIA